MPDSNQIARLAARLSVGLALSLSAGAVWPQEIELEDDAGRVLRLTDAAQRIVSLSPHLSELVYFAGALPKLVGVSSHCDYPPEVEALSKVADSYSIDYEGLISLRPDLVLAWRAGINAVQLEKLTHLVKRVYISDPNDFNAIADNLIDLGQLAGTSAHANRAALNFLNDVNRLRNDKPDRHYRALYLVAAQPPLAIGKEHWIAKTMALCGADSVIESGASQVILLNRESLLLESIDALIHSMEDETAVTAVMPSIPSIYLPADTIQRPTPRVIHAAESLCRQLDDLNAMTDN